MTTVVTTWARASKEEKQPIFSVQIYVVSKAVMLDSERFSLISEGRDAEWRIQVGELNTTRDTVYGKNGGQICRWRMF